MAVDITKVQEKAPGLVNLTKQAGVSLSKAGLDTHTASVILVMDVSASTRDLYASGAMQGVADKAFVTALHWDDDGEVPLCLFDHAVHDAGVLTLDNYVGYIDKARRGLEGGTEYARVIRWCRQTASPGRNRGRFSLRRQEAPTAATFPTYVLFVTDGEPNDSRHGIQEEIRAASHEPIFFQFIGVGVGKGRPGKPSFPFLEGLDDLDGRLIDNADFFAVENPTVMDDSEMFERLLAEYPGWIPQARKHGLIV